MRRITLDMFRQLDKTRQSTLVRIEKVVTTELVRMDGQVIGRKVDRGGLIDCQGDSVYMQQEKLIK